MIKLVPKDPSACPGYMLDLWCFYERVSKIELAKRLNVTRNYIHLVINGKRRFVSQKLADSIERITKGYVKSSWLRRPKKKGRPALSKGSVKYSKESVRKYRQKPDHVKNVSRQKKEAPILQDKE